MSKILIIDIDSTRRNYALDKIKIYHKLKGDKVRSGYPYKLELYDKVYCSVVFGWNKKLVEKYEGRAEIGGSGYDIYKKLPSEIDKIKIHKNYGYTSRGCFRNCAWCIVPAKEGKLKYEMDLLDLWDGKNKDITLYDNNILAMPDHFRKVCKQAKNNKIRLDFNSGLDFRLINDENLQEINNISHRVLRFSWDNINDRLTVINKIKLLNKYEFKRSIWYILTGYNSEPAEDLERVNELRSLGQYVYLMRYKKTAWNGFLKRYCFYQIYGKVSFSEWIKTNNYEDKLKRIIEGWEG